MTYDISIIIPTKDRLWSLPKAVESCRSSRLRIQLIIVDDASTDGTIEWLQSQPDITVVDGVGWGQGWAFNKAFPLASGKYIRFLDSDDWLNPNSNEAQFDLAEKEQADVVVAGMDSYNDETLAAHYPWVPTTDFISQQLGEAAGSHYAAFLFRREFIQDIPHRSNFPANDFAVRLDRCFILEVALLHPKIAVYPEPTLCHRQHNRERLQFQKSMRSIGTHLQHLYIYRQVLHILERRGELNPRRKKAAAKALWPLAHMIALTHPKEGSEVADWVFQLDPDFEMPESGMLGNLYRGLGFRQTEQLLRWRRMLLTPFRTQSN